MLYKSGTKTKSEHPHSSQIHNEHPLAQRRTYVVVWYNLPFFQKFFVVLWEKRTIFTENTLTFMDIKEMHVHFVGHLLIKLSIIYILLAVPRSIQPFGHPTIWSFYWSSFDKTIHHLDTSNSHPFHPTIWPSCPS